MAKKAIKLHDKRTLHVYSSSQDLNDWLAEFNWVASYNLVEIRRRLLSDDSALLLIDMRKSPDETLVHIRNLHKYFPSVVKVVLIDDEQLHWGQKALAFGADAYMSCGHISSVGLWMLIDSLLKQKSQHLTLSQSGKEESLINQMLYFDRLKHALMGAIRHQCHTGILLINLNDYRAIIKKHNGALSEGLLTKLEKRLASVMRNSDSLARLQPGIYGVILLGLKDEVAVANIARKIQEVFEEAIPISNFSYQISVSIGGHICLADNIEADMFYQQACVALQYAKKNPKQDIWFYEQALNFRTTARANIESGLAKALTNEEFFLQYIPSHLGNSHLINGVMALLRWEHPSSGTVLPSVFIEQLINSGLIIEVGEWWIDSAFNQFKEWLDNRHVSSRQQLFLTITQEQLSHAGFIKMLAKNLALYQISARKIVLVVSEIMAINNIKQLKTLSISLPGICLSVQLGDFTKGYSSLTYLKEIDVDYIFLDSHLVQNSYLDVRESSIVKIIIDIAHTMGIEVMATGIHSLAQAEKMQSLGCDSLQGDYFSSPLYANLWPKYIHRNTS